MNDKDWHRDHGCLSTRWLVSCRPRRGFFYLALTRETFYKARMVSAARLLIFGSVILTGCDTVKTAAVGTFRVVDAPAHYVRQKIDSPPPTATTTTAANGTSDVSTPGQPVNPPAKTSSSTETRAPTQNRETAPTRGTSASETKAPTTTTSRKPSPSATPRAANTKTVEFPTARPVPGKPGYVYSVDPQGGIIDVTGYKPGDKAKDPYTKQIFIVP